MNDSIVKTWTFLIQGGGQPFELRLEKNPVLEYVGKRDIWRMVGTAEEAEQAEVFIKRSGCTVEVHAEGQTEDQIRERKILLGRLPQ